MRYTDVSRGIILLRKLVVESFLYFDGCTLPLRCCGLIVAGHQHFPLKQSFVQPLLVCDAVEEWLTERLSVKTS